MVSPRVLPYNKVHAASYHAIKADDADSTFRVDHERDGHGVWNGRPEVYSEQKPARESLTPEPQREAGFNIEKGGETETDARHSPHPHVAPEEAFKVLNRSIVEPLVPGGRRGRNGSRAQVRDEESSVEQHRRLRSRALSSIDAAIVAVSNHLEDDRASWASRFPATGQPNENGRAVREPRLGYSSQLDLRGYDRRLQLRGYELNGAQVNGEVNGAQNCDITGAADRDDHSVVSTSSSITSATLKIRPRALGAHRADKVRSRATTGASTLQSSDSVEISAQTATQTFPNGLNLRASEEGRASSHLLDTRPSAEAVMVSRIQEHPNWARSPRMGTVPAGASHDRFQPSPHASKAGLASIDSAGAKSTISEASRSNDRSLVRSGRPRKSRERSGPAKH